MLGSKFQWCWSELRLTCEGLGRTVGDFLPPSVPAVRRRRLKESVLKIWNDSSRTWLGWNKSMGQAWASTENCCSKSEQTEVEQVEACQPTRPPAPLENVTCRKKFALTSSKIQVATNSAIVCEAPCKGHLRRGSGWYDQSKL